MITTNFQKWGALVASLASILTLSSAAEAITLTIADSGPNPNAAGGLYSITTKSIGKSYAKAEAISDLSLVIAPYFNSITIKNLVLSGSKGKLSAMLTAIDQNGDIFGQSQLFNAFTGTGANSSIISGDYTFTSIPSPGLLTWASATNTPGTYASAGDLSADFFGAPLDNTIWRLDFANNPAGGTGSFGGFSVDATVPFESNAAPAGVAIVFGALMLRRKLQQRSAQKMSLESVNS
jgi:hypothetical protein